MFHNSDFFPSKTYGFISSFPTTLSLSGCVGMKRCMEEQKENEFKDLDCACRSCMGPGAGEGVLCVCHLRFLGLSFLHFIYI